MTDKKSVKRHSHPGRGGHGASFPKGRQLDPDSHVQIRELLGNKLRTRELLIEHLHLVQDEFGHLSSGHLVALAEELKMALTEVYEVATFYAHFDVVRDDETPPPAMTIRVCDSVTCELFGSEKLIEELAKNVNEDIRVLRAPCMGACDKAPAVSIGFFSTTTSIFVRLKVFLFKSFFIIFPLNPAKIYIFLKLNLQK